jgi:sugar/nucleoside kinase (ribokinase family)
MGPKLVSVTDGAKGSLLTDGKKVVRSGIYKVDVLDTTGAGDAFLSGILISKLNNYPLDKMTKLATAMSSFESMKTGVREGIASSLQELEDFIKSHELQQTVSEFSQF